MNLSDALEELRSPDLGTIEFHDFLGGDLFRAFLAEVTDAFETNSHPSALWAKWIEVVVERPWRLRAMIRRREAEEGPTTTSLGLALTPRI